MGSVRKAYRRRDIDIQTFNGLAWLSWLPCDVWQEWSKARLLQIQDLLNWELEKLTQVVAQFLPQHVAEKTLTHGLDKPLASLRANLKLDSFTPSSQMTLDFLHNARKAISRDAALVHERAEQQVICRQQSSIPKISQAIEETLEPSFDEGESIASREIPSPMDLNEISITRNSWRKKTPFIKASDLADLQSEYGSESSVTDPTTLQQGGPGMRLSKGSLQSSALHSSETEGMEVISTGETASAESGAQNPQLLQVITDQPSENASSPSSCREVKEGSLPSSMSPQMKRLQSGQESMIRSRRSSARLTRLQRLVHSQ
ncbi:unnamed protein product, partial [Cladocopium goreaui]